MAKRESLTKIEDQVILNSQQACLELRIVGDYRNFILKKYSGQLMALEQWKEKLRMEGLAV